METLTWICLVSAAWTSYLVLASEHNLHSHILVYDGDEHINATKGCGGLQPPFQLAPNPECIYYCLKETKNNQSKEQVWSYDHYKDGTLCAYPDENATEGFTYGVCSNFSCNTSAPVNISLLNEIMKRPSAPTTISPKPSSTTKNVTDHFDHTTTISPKSTSTTENITEHVDQTTISPKPSSAAENITELFDNTTTVSPIPSSTTENITEHSDHTSTIQPKPSSGNSINEISELFRATLAMLPPLIAYLSL
uniref:Putative dnaj log subfamily protein c member 1 n=1 Tax=Ixodes ricinus TaxID=34613 RepID=A0A0K8RHA9_IXORI